MAVLKAILILLPLLAYYLYRRLQWYRFEQQKDFPRPPTDLLWGHVKLINERIQDPKEMAGRHSGTRDFPVLIE